MLSEDEGFVPFREREVEVHESVNVVQFDVGFLGVAVIFVLLKLVGTLLDIGRVVLLIERTTDLEQLSEQTLAAQYFDCLFVVLGLHLQFACLLEIVIFFHPLRLFLE